MFWGKSADDKKSNSAHDTDDTEVPRLRKEPRPDSLSQPVPREKLPKKLQSLIDQQDEDEPFLDRLYEGHAQDSTDTSVRYAAYATRIRTILLSAHRYVAYTSDIGESFRPVAHPYLIKSAYAVSWLYLLGDVSYEGRKAYLRNQQVRAPTGNEYQNATSAKVVESVKSGAAKIVTIAAPGTKIAKEAEEAATTATAPGHVPAIEDYRAVMAQRAIFQSVASMGLPAFTIHSIVRYSGQALKNVKNTKIRSWGPIGLGLAAVPFLPYMFDEPVEEAVDWAFYNGFKMIGGEQAVGARHAHGHEKVDVAVDKVKSKVKEL